MPALSTDVDQLGTTTTEEKKPLSRSVGPCGMTNVLYICIAYPHEQASCLFVSVRKEPASFAASPGLHNNLAEGFQPLPLSNP